VRTWASEQRVLEAIVAAPPRPPIDANYERIRERLRQSSAKSQVNPAFF
jgi:hypothetical protein